MIDLALRNSSKVSEDQLLIDASVAAATEVVDLANPFSESKGLSEAAKKAKACLELAEKTEPHRGTSAGAIAGTVVGGIGGAAVACALVFPPLLPLVVIGGFFGFKWGSSR